MVVGWEEDVSNCHHLNCITGMTVTAVTLNVPWRAAPRHLVHAQDRGPVRTPIEFDSLIPGCALVVVLDELLQVQQLPPSHDQVANRQPQGGPAAGSCDDLEQQARHARLLRH